MHYRMDIQHVEAAFPMRVEVRMGIEDQRRRREDREYARQQQRDDRELKMAVLFTMSHWTEEHVLLLLCL